MIEIGVAGKAERIVGKNRNALAAILNRNRTANAQVAALAAVMANAGLADEFNKRRSAAIEDRHFQVVDLDVRVVDAGAIEDAEQVLGGRDEYAFAHQA